MKKWALRFTVAALLFLLSLHFFFTDKKVMVPRSVSDASVSKSDVPDLVEKCFHGTNISRGAPSQMLQDAKANAEYMFQEFRKVIPEKSLDGYGSHCWRESYSVQWDDTKYSGHIGKFSFSGMMSDMAIRKDRMFLLNRYSHQKYRTKLICLPKVFLIGYFKCGSTFIYCLIHKLISLTLSESLRWMPLKTTALRKEPTFWVAPYQHSSHSELQYTTPSASSLGRYIFNYLPGLEQISQERKKEVILIDGKINKIFRWPQFNMIKQHKATNYCLLPAVLPTLFPDSKFIVIMREPVNFLYSMFWHRCTLEMDEIPMKLQLKGPNLFHQRAVANIHAFTDCMKDESVPSISQPCELGNGNNYSSCILQRLHLLDSCAQSITNKLFSPGDLLKCGTVQITIAMFYVHARKWLTILPRDRIHFMFLEDWITDLTGSAHDALDFLGLDTSITARPKLIKEAADSCGQNEQVKVDYKNNPKLEMKEETRELLSMFYKPFNTLFAQLIGRTLPW